MSKWTSSLLAVLGLLAFGLAPASAGPVIIAPGNVSISDPVGDQTGSVDLVNLQLVWDISNGNYVIRLNAHPANPFVGPFRINVNLYNATVPPLAGSFPTFFQDAVNDYNLAAPTTQIVLSGTHSALTSWLPGHQIAASTFAGLGNPVGSSFFRTAVGDLPQSGFLGTEDFLDTSSFAQPGAPFQSFPDATVSDLPIPQDPPYGGSPVPEPGTAALFLAGLGLALVAARRRRTTR